MKTTKKQTADVDYRAIEDIVMKDNNNIDYKIDKIGKLGFISIASIGEFFLINIDLQALQKAIRGEFVKIEAERTMKRTYLYIYFRLNN